MLRRHRRQSSETIVLKENNYKPEFEDCAKLSKLASVLEESDKGKLIFSLLKQNVFSYVLQEMLDTEIISSSNIKS